MTSAYEQNRLNLNNSRNIDPNRFKDQMDTVKKIVNPEDPTFISELFLDLKTGYTTFKSAPGGLYIKGGSALGAIGLRRLIKKADIPQKVYTNFNDLRRLSNIGEEVTRKTGIENVARDSGVVQFINQDPNILDSLTKGSNSYNKINEIKARYPNRQIYDFKPKGVEKEKFVQEHLAIKAKGGNIPYFLEKGRLKYLDLKVSNYRGTGQPRYNFVDLQNKLANEATRRALKLEKSIPIEDYIIELGKEQGTKAFNFNKAKMKKLYRWVSEEGAHLDHMWPLVSTKTEGFHHINNLILLYAKDNLKKSNKVLPKALFEELGIPLSKRDLIRSTLQKPKTTNKVKRQKILEALGILETK